MLLFVTEYYEIDKLFLLIEGQEKPDGTDK